MIFHTLLECRAKGGVIYISACSYEICECCASGETLSLSMLKTALAVEAAVLRPKSFISVNARNVKMAQSTVEL